jgi:aspartyl-tRNA synthetase
MADQPPAQQSLPERPKDDAAAATSAATAALKKLAKEKEKAEKAAKRAAEEAARKKESEANDVSADSYGELPMIRQSTGVTHSRLEALKEKYDGQDFEEGRGPEVVFRAAVENARNQSAKLSFLVFGQGHATIQAVVAASETLSRQMVK